MVRLLIVDDEEEICEGMKNGIDWNHNGIEVVGTCRDGISAEEAIIDLLPDIVMIDIEMPGKNGLQVISEIRSLNLNVGFIILSGWDKFEYARQAIEYGVINYLLKPCGNEEILQSVFQAIRKIKSKNNHKFGSWDTQNILSYPVKEERNILECLENQRFVQLDHGLHVFVDAVCEKNGLLENQICCCVMLQMEINRLLIEYGFVIEVDMMVNNSIQDKQQLFKHVQAFVGQAVKYLSKRREGNAYAANAKRIIEKRYADDLKLEQIAGEIGISPAYLSSIFKKQTGIGISQYINYTRIEQAKKLLESGKMVYEAAELVGIKDVKYFSHVFRKIAGQSAVSYRNNCAH